MSDEKCSCTGSPPSLPLITIGKLLRGQSDGILERLFALCEKNRRTQLWDALFYFARMWDFSDLLVFLLVGWVDIKNPTCGFFTCILGEHFFESSRARRFTCALGGHLTCRASHS